MVPNGTPDGSNHSSKFDTTLALRFVLAIVSTLVALPLILSVIGAPIGIPIFIAGIKPLKDYFVEMSNQSVKNQEEPWQRGELNLCTRQNNCTTTSSSRSLVATRSTSG